jgi:hypothetical protein
MFRSGAFFLVTLGVVSVAACRDAAGPNELNGDYRLVRINGSEIPAPSDGCGIPVLSGSLEISHGLASRTVDYRINGARTKTRAIGPVSLTGTTVQFELTEIGGNVWHVSGTWASGRITLTYPAPCDGTVSEVFDRE